MRTGGRGVATPRPSCCLDRYARVSRISPFEPGQDLVSEWEQVVDANLFVGLSEGADQLCRDLYGYQATVTDGC